jgi:uncharacterized protein
VPAYVALGQFTRANALATLALLPFAIAGALIGVWLIRKVSPERFYALVYWLMIIAGGKLIWDGASL